MFNIPSFMGFDKAGFGDPDALAFFARVTAAGGSLTATEKSAVTTLVTTLKANSLWTPMKAIYPMVGGGTGTTAAREAACAQNLKSASFPGTFTSGWTFASTGATPNGTSAYMMTGFLESANLTLNSGHLSFYSRTQISTNEDRADIGVIGFSPVFLSTIFSETSTPGTAGFACQNIIASQLISNTNTLGLFISTRTQSNEIRSFLRNTKYTAAINSSNLSTIEYYIGARNFNGSLNAPSNKQCAFSSMGDGLTDTQAGDLYTAVQAFQTTLSRQV